jgi:hypothetical protein
MYLLCVKMNCNTVLQNIYGILLYKNCVYLCIYHWFHILFSDTQIHGLFVHTYVSLSVSFSISLEALIIQQLCGPVGAVFKQFYCTCFVADRKLSSLLKVI